MYCIAQYIRHSIWHSTWKFFPFCLLISFNIFLIIVKYSLFPKTWKFKWSSDWKSKSRPWWSRFRSHFKWAVSKETCEDHRGFHFNFDVDFKSDFSGIELYSCGSVTKQTKVSMSFFLQQAKSRTSHVYTLTCMHICIYTYIHMDTYLVTYIPLHTYLCPSLTVLM